MKIRIFATLFKLYNQKKWLKNLDIIENYLNTKELFTKENLQDFMTLYKGSSELRRLGEILHVNQGLYTTISESQNYISKITDLI